MPEDLRLVRGAAIRTALGAAAAAPVAQPAVALAAASVAEPALATAS